MLAWELKWALNGDRLDFQVNIVFGVCFFAGRHRPLRARARWERARARVGRSVLPTIGKTPCWPGN